MRILVVLFFFALQITPVSAQKPKIVIGVVVDQMRYDFLYRYESQYTNDGFKRLMREGTNCTNTHYPYYQTVTAAGHATVYTGSVPAHHGIIGNSWYDRESMRNIYCTEDKSVTGVECSDRVGQRSPRNMWSTTIGDQLKLSTNFKSKVYGISIKDRGAILPAGHSANSALWFDYVSGKFISSSFYGDKLPASVVSFNNKKRPHHYVQKPWELSLPITQYTQSTVDDVPWEGISDLEEQSVFPHLLKAPFNNPFSELTSSPHGNTILFELAKEIIEGEKLGSSDVTDMLCISFSSPDLIGHRFGPNSIETQDTYLRLDKEMGEFLKYLDKRYGVGNYLMFLTADHGVMDVPGFWKANKLPAIGVSDISMKKVINDALSSKYGNHLFIPAQASVYEEVFFDQAVLDSLNLSFKDIHDVLYPIVTKLPHVANLINLRDFENAPISGHLKNFIRNGYNNQRTGDMLIVNKPGTIMGYKTGTGHGTPYEYDTHVPLLFFGTGIPAGEINTRVSVSDIASSIANKLKILSTSNNTGEPVWGKQ